MDKEHHITGCAPVQCASQIERRAEPNPGPSRSAPSIPQTGPPTPAAGGQARVPGGPAFAWSACTARQVSGACVHTSACPLPDSPAKMLSWQVHIAIRAMACSQPLCDLAPAAMESVRTDCWDSRPKSCRDLVRANPRHEVQAGASQSGAACGSAQTAVIRGGSACGTAAPGDPQSPDAMAGWRPSEKACMHGCR